MAGYNAPRMPLCRVRSAWLWSACVVTLTIPATLAAQDESKTYTDSRGKKIVFKQGDASFADEVVSFDLGKPAPSASRQNDPKIALGVPDYDPRGRGPADLSLGCGGTLVIRFNDNAAVDVPGPDLYVFEVGPNIEGVRLAISQDGASWIDAGNISGGTAEVDMASVAKPGERYRYIKLTDLKSACGGNYPGADIDAVGAIGSAFQIALDAAVLFDFDKSDLKPQAQAALIDAAAKIAARKDGSITIEGHSDNVGGADYNRKLSQARAESVRAFFAARPELKGRVMTARGFGAQRPIATNDTDVGRQQNRRVEIVIAPSQ
jgi:outer membrane protein OmpA-like peptidoglycan-associated protein